MDALRLLQACCRRNVLILVHSGQVNNAEILSGHVRRGLLLRALARLFGTWGRWVGPSLAVVLSGLAFGLAHYEPLQLLGLALFGILLGAVSYCTGRQGMNMVAHATFNGIALAATAVVPVLSHGWPA